MTTKPARIDHSACTHPRTFAGRSECRAARRAATPAPTSKVVTKTTATKKPASTAPAEKATTSTTKTATKKAVPPKTATLGATKGTTPGAPAPSGDAATA